MCNSLVPVLCRRVMALYYAILVLLHHRQFPNSIVPLSNAGAVNCDESGNTAADCTAECAATYILTTAASGGGTACTGEYTCLAGDGACPAGEKMTTCAIKQNRISAPGCMILFSLLLSHT